MKERPILFSGDMVRAILDGRKTQTRRVLKEIHSTFELARHLDDMFFFKRWNPHQKDYQRVDNFKCKYGKPGDRLWVRETHHYQKGENFVRYKATGDALHELKKWKSSIHMPRWASRILLEITDIRVERVQDISDKDAEAEGIRLEPTDGRYNCSGKYIMPFKPQFVALWDSINKKRGYGWSMNPWVWVVEFKKLEATNGNNK